MKKLTILIAVFATILGISGCFDEEKWTAFVYPNRYDLTRDIELGDFSNISQCQSAVSAWMVQHNNFAADYECGLNCDKSKGKPHLCKETKW